MGQNEYDRVGSIVGSALIRGTKLELTPRLVDCHDRLRHGYWY